MKLLFTLLLGTLISTITYSQSYKRMDFLTQKMRLSSKEIFIVNTKGDTLTGDKISGPSGTGKAYDYALNKKDYFKLDGNKYEEDQVESFQDKYAIYYRMYSTNILGNSVFSYVKLLYKGKINVYFNGDKRDPVRGTLMNTFSFQKGNEPIAELTTAEIVERLKDNQEALDKFSKYFHPERKHLNIVRLDADKLIEVMEIYNK